MGRDSIDEMIEGWAKGLGKGTRTAVEKSDQGALSGWAAPTEEADPAHLKAALAVREEIGDGSGPKKGMWTYRNVVRASLDVKRLSSKVFEAVLKLGYDRQLFELDDTSLSYPFLVGLDTQPEPVTEPEPEPVVEVSPTQKVKPQPKRKSPPKDPPKNWKPQGWLPCGHQFYQTLKKTDAEMTDAERKRMAADKKGLHGVHPTKTVYVTSSKKCPACKAGAAGNPRWQTGDYRTPLSESSRRSPEREDSLGFPGHCADPKTGFYIGGVGNDCRRYHDGPERCVVHAPPTKQKRKSPRDRRKEKKPA